jgi:hypothetical protein
MSTTEAGKSWSADLTKHSGGEALHPLWVAEVEGRITTIEREAAEKERERLLDIFDRIKSTMTLSEQGAVLAVLTVESVDVLRVVEELDVNH